MSKGKEGLLVNMGRKKIKNLDRIKIQSAFDRLGYGVK